jgi:LEA14-like dessication related protein
MKELSSLSKCEFRLSDVDSFILTGIYLDDINTYSDLNIIQIGVITRAMADRNLPLSFTMNIETRNPNAVPAALNKLEYITVLDDTEIARGVLNERVYIPPSGGISVIPLRVTMNLADLFSKESLVALFNLALNLSDAGGRPSRISLKIKPYIKAGKKDLIYPGYINVKTEFTSAGEE